VSVIGAITNNEIMDQLLRFVNLSTYVVSPTAYYYYIIIIIIKMQTLVDTPDRT